jgi:hypothetical protein
VIAKLGSEGRLTLSGWLLKQLDLSGFSWRTKNSFWDGKNIQEGKLYVKDTLDQNKLFKKK